ncbi:hypothetical protein SPRG_02323 [Saprolegnia parasitica CBS 223.65]|uniref:Uncharacterized protein n=1 Tax=Saprolegnia parasitica (strain CBS 223.65) TaxID=695850 RepID=A0A067D0R7_SAPPC|nr:hypothetical protein SPRG_02323 [Saprolegnia parasitica CBS 223.65]KDO32622.1 hypothetical protein SPRG_02323 [Saprolegnia parasitica CBS 223.65]|eukprot:XP_012196290.1 hypothetical protein SPRG_02323 [Saprolegnia parasitica CBS 223.65]
MAPHALVATKHARAKHVGGMRHSSVTAPSAPAFSLCNAALAVLTIEGLYLSGMALDPTIDRSTMPPEPPKARTRHPRPAKAHSMVRRKRPVDLKANRTLSQPR